MSRSMMSRARALTALVGAWALARGGPARAAGGAEVPAVVAVLDGLPAGGALAAARDQLTARWRLEIVRPAAPERTEAPVDVEPLLRAYLDADFLLCLSELQGMALDPDRLLERGLRAEAAQVTTLAAACSLGAGDERQARELIRRLVARGLDAPQVLRRTTPRLQRLVEDEQQESRRRERVDVEIATEPPGGSVAIDGRLACAAAPCRERLLAGEHLFRAERLGRRPRTLSAALDERDRTLTLPLEMASADEAARALSVSLAAGRDPSSVEVLETAAQAFGAEVIVLVWARGSETHASVYRRNGARSTHVVMEVPGADGVERVVRAALVQRDRGDICLDAFARPEALPPLAPRPIEPARVRRGQVIWASTLGLLLAGALAVFLVSRSDEPREVDVTFGALRSR